MLVLRNGLKYLALAACGVVVVACSSSDKQGSASGSDTGVATTDASTASSNTNAPSGPLTLTVADLDGFEKGIARETELVREASDRASKAKTAQERGEAIQAGFETSTMAAAAPVTGLSPERYKLVRETLSTLLTTLDFQGKIDGPQSYDISRADSAMKVRLQSDPYAALDPAGAAELKSRMSRIVPLWVSYINLTAVAG
jgi:hypothetical protein